MANSRSSWIFALNESGGLHYRQSKVLPDGEVLDEFVKSDKLIDGFDEMLSVFMDTGISEILIHQSENGVTKINVTFKDETVWLSQQQRAELFQILWTNVVEHKKGIFYESISDT